MQVSTIADATAIEFQWSCGCSRIVEHSGKDRYCVTDSCGQVHTEKLQLCKAKRTLHAQG
ncbi:MAG: hypothetical protein C0402_05275 [Thermodesulfovibrio sp.]|nr:hypothetical protein [Thermodesulfovibrio sp.]